MNASFPASPVIWVLTDGRAGTDNQALGVAEKLGLPFEEKRLAFNGWIAIPSSLVICARLALIALVGVLVFGLGASFEQGSPVWLDGLQHPETFWTSLWQVEGYEGAPLIEARIKPLFSITFVMFLGVWLLQSMGDGIRLKKSQLAAPWPDAVISAGRRGSRAARLIARRARRTGRHPFLAQIMKPEWSWNSYYHFDALSIPAHDRVPDDAVGDDLDAPLLLRPLLTPHRVTHAKLEAAKSEWQTAFAHLPKPWIGVLVGGDSAHAHFTPDDITRTVKQAQALAAGGALLVTTSRRTGVILEKALATSLEAIPHFHYSPREGDANPYLGILACADALVVTADSLSMLSEAIFTGKPVHAQAPSTLAAKHVLFMSRAGSEGFLNTDLNLGLLMRHRYGSLGHFPQNPEKLRELDSAKDLADFIGRILEIRQKEAGGRLDVDEAP